MRTSRKAGHEDKASSPDTALARRGRRPAAEVAARCARFSTECRSRGIRITAQRVAVFQAVVEDPSHPTAEAVHRRILAHLGSMSLGTVYRTLEFLVGAGLLRRVSTPESISRFDANLTAHQHLVCRSCGLMQDWEVAAWHRVRLPRSTAPGFHAESLDIRILGLCARCARAAGKPHTRSPGT